MGVCLSCLRGIDDDDQSINETTPLINDGHDYDKDRRLKEREEQLNEIVNDTNDHLIDIQNFFNPLESSMKDPPAEDEGRTSQAKLITNEYISPEEKAALSELHQELFKIVKEDTTVDPVGPLIANFNS
ncbi:uncharacterized protein CYBJADRAFT_167060 [Cyberlindnera jadinii NRRL Y-1542]|uniref:Uncharacterized protein n=1 Tax=Cyberlindnera jadinii (strain ATCC 18201 / CBS 1600 / BCRC 20928 / JCM 3617 / NBRC 0987 / NRRL Y-1542) TaxID=983966 RepID=A0A1E4S4D3_CYBJN|nr:hypothetical protein CYBJADRAFT_167060 [Cyberlindnera jadinii NRRL Y-1542]ODV74386.1 hypothetical protein CYBJADRAFT_167060 [Cyberlindnera jadinii NRRL Y-1542]